MFSKSNPLVVFALDLMSTYEGEHMLFGLLQPQLHFKLQHKQENQALELLRSGARSSYMGMYFHLQ
jgi:hypothetical protein